MREVIDPIDDPSDEDYYWFMARRFGEAATMVESGSTEDEIFEYLYDMEGFECYD